MKVSASIAAADWARLGEECADITSAGVDRLHVDIEDGVFSRELTFGPRVIHALKTYCAVPMEAHLMVVRPEDWVRELARSGVRRIYVHGEACLYPLEILAMIRECGCEAGLAVNPKTPLEPFLYCSDILNAVLIMTAEFDGHGQAWIPSIQAKLARARHCLPSRVEVWADGSVSLEVLPALVAAGVDGVVIGRALFRARARNEVVAAFKRAGLPTP